ncbi:unnamed protein product [Thlaspi arvense]|uniref:Late embryogenesis abundant protein LEA-2 subgroup domain-containing protein n=1 Tax=Thlaspi arvense TaxID=13288 RepID=A0AAU9SDR1_THLAR|nr:unnamed protein product [Thlaspi arvense]
MQQEPNPRPATGYPYPHPYPDPPQQPAASANGYPPNAGTAYPYQNHNPYYAPQPNPRAILLRRLFIAFLVFILILGLILFILMLVFRSQYPDVYINSLSVSNFNVSNNHLSGKWDLQLQFRNPNSKMSLQYDTVFLTLYYHRPSRISLSDTRLQPFDQGTKDQTPVNATLSVAGTYVDGRMTNSILEDRSGGRVEFDLRIDSTVTFRYGAFRRRRYVRSYCDDVAVGIPASRGSGEMIGPSKRCKSY